MQRNVCDVVEAPSPNVRVDCVLFSSGRDLEEPLANCLPKQLATWSVDACSRSKPQLPSTEQELNRGAHLQSITLVAYACKLAFLLPAIPRHLNVAAGNL